jgi:hypothetical protein
VSGLKTIPGKLICTPIAGDVPGRSRKPQETKTMNEIK